MNSFSRERHFNRNKYLFLRYLNFEPNFKLLYCARDLFGSQIPVTTVRFELRIAFIIDSYLIHQAIRPYC